MKNKAELITAVMTAVFLAGVVIWTAAENSAELLPSAPVETGPAVHTAAPLDGAVYVSITRRLDINTATAPELEELPGIGPVLAERIVEYREKNGPFSSLEDLLEVPGIGKSTLDKIYERLEQ